LLVSVFPGGFGRSTFRFSILSVHIRSRRSVPVEPACVSFPVAKHKSDRPEMPLMRFALSLQRLPAMLRHPRRPAFGPSRYDVCSFRGSAGDQRP
jgi:hypothetical protein